MQIVSSYILNKNYQKRENTVLFRTILIDIKTTAIRFVVGGERLGKSTNIAWAVEIHSRGEGC